MQWQSINIRCLFSHSALVICRYSFLETFYQHNHFIVCLDMLCVLHYFVRQFNWQFQQLLPVLYYLCYICFQLSVFPRLLFMTKNKGFVFWFYWKLWLFLYARLKKRRIMGTRAGSREFVRSITSIVFIV